MCLSIYLFLCSDVAGNYGKNGKNATKTGAEILPWAVKCPYMAEKI